MLYEFSDCGAEVDVPEPGSAVPEMKWGHEEAIECVQLIVHHNKSLNHLDTISPTCRYQGGLSERH